MSKAVMYHSPEDARQAASVALDFTLSPTAPGATTREVACLDEQAEDAAREAIRNSLARVTSEWDTADRE